jgi:tRNA(Arg) A34 adenosine deaminase TadA
MNTNLSLTLPDWLDDIPVPTFEQEDDHAKIGFALELAKSHIEHDTGGPFAAFIYSRKRRAILSLGVNVVVPQHCAVGHAEIMALAMAQQQEACYELSDLECELISSCEPCGMCLGAILWSGISRLVYSATTQDAEAIGFDEGLKPKGWKNACGQRGMTVASPVRVEEGVAVLRTYAANGKTIYNSGTHL